MATTPARPATPPARYAARHLWQLPAFFLGILALAAVALGRPLLHGDPAQRAERDIAGLREAIDHTPPDFTHAQSLRPHVQAAAERYPQFAGTAYLLLGTLDVKLADARQVESPAETYKSARQSIERAAELGVGDADQGRLNFRIAQVWERCGNVEPEKIIYYCSQALRNTLSPPTGDDQAECYRILSVSTLRLPPAKMTPALLTQARDWTLKSLSLAAANADPMVLYRSRLQLAEIHLKLKEEVEARKVLERFGPDAPADMYVNARTYLARSYQDESDWPKAVQNWELARDAKNCPPAARGTILYQLGLCYSKVGKAKDAGTAWEQAQQLGGTEGQASSLRLAALRLGESGWAAVTEAITNALKEVSRSDEYKNSLVPILEAQQTVELAVLTFKSAKEFELAQRMARLYGKIAAPDRDRELFAEVTAAWGDDLLTQAKQSPTAEEEARKRYRQAAVEYQTVADSKRGPEAGDWLAKAADRYRAAGDHRLALQMLDKVIALPGYPDDKAGRAFYLIGQAQQDKGDPEAARTAYAESAKRVHPDQARARLQLSVMKAEAGQYDAAIEELKKNIEPPASQADKDTYVDSLYALADTFFNKRDYVNAEFKYLEALREGPAKPQWTRAEFRLGRCYWYQASKMSKALQDPGLAKDARDAYKRQYDEFLQSAIGPFEKVESEVLSRQSKNEPLNPGDLINLRQSSFAVAECYFYLGQYEEAVSRYILLEKRYDGQVEQLVALSQLWQCYDQYLRQPEKAKETLKRMRESFLKMNDGSFDNMDEQHTRPFWDNWFKRLEMAP
jgi:tetratricopeptide (TPR) repeat protein